MTTVGASSIGRPGDRAAVRSLTFDDVVATYVVDGVITMPPTGFFPAIPSDYWSTRPDLCTETGDLVMSAGGLLVERGDDTLLIDTGVGAMTTDFAWGSVDCGSLLDVLGIVGRRPEDIDVVAFTHLHFDHAGWSHANGDKTFPNARYVMAAAEWAPHRGGTPEGDAVTPKQIIAQLADQRIDLIDDGDEVVPGVRAVVTPGHTPGHTSYVITSTNGQRLVVFGDAFHIPAQLAHPEWMSVAEWDAAEVVTARRRLLAELAEPNTLGFGFHFGDQPFGRVTADGGWAPVPTVVLAPPPR
ncbi:MBL fold metallo-hydrolase [Mycobacterium sp. NPDC048908]|uniref:MBL fold metallo-hydrolase n=1 Tax=Mycobacterium sp. NPDC048908 TaxID=3364292 RepID=UPI0037176C05